MKGNGKEQTNMEEANVICMWGRDIPRRAALLGQSNFQLSIKLTLVLWLLGEPEGREYFLRRRWGRRKERGRGG